MSLPENVKRRSVNRCHVLVVRDRPQNTRRLWRVVRDELGPSHPLDERYDATVAARRAAFDEFEAHQRRRSDDGLELEEYSALDLADFVERFRALRVDTRDVWQP